MVRPSHAHEGQRLVVIGIVWVFDPLGYLGIPLTMFTISASGLYAHRHLTAKPPAW